jgi:predicted NBD/HSP70 family sugar kinase
MNNSQVIRGVSGFAGEIGCIPIEGKKCISHILKEGDKKSIVSAFSKIVSMIASLINSQCVIFGGNGIDEEFCKNVHEETKEYIPADRVPECIFTENVTEDYFAGLLYLGMDYYFNEIEVK